MIDFLIAIFCIFTVSEACRTMEEAYTNEELVDAGSVIISFS